jgi:hypothetical protein
MILTACTYERSINCFIEFRKKAEDLLYELDPRDFSRRLTEQNSIHEITAEVTEKTRQ